jgi:hypothetical protein
MTITTALLVATLAADAAASPTPAAGRPPARPPTAPTASLPTVEGEILEVDHATHRLRLRTAEGELLLFFDRNTLVLGPAGAATPLILTAGAKVRAGREGDTRASWIELKAPPSTPTAGP